MLPAVKCDPFPTIHALHKKHIGKTSQREVGYNLAATAGDLEEVGG